MSAGVRPLLLAALAEDSDALGERPVLSSPPTIARARDMARELAAYLAPRRVRYYPSRGTGYESHLAPPPHLVGLRIAALDALAGGGEEDDAGAPVVVASAVALAEAVPDASLRPAGFVLHKDEEVDLDDVAELLAGAGYERVEQVEDRGQFAVRGGILDVFGATEDAAARIELFGDEIESIRWFSTFTQRSLGDAERVELDPAAEIDPDHRLLAEAALSSAAEDGEAQQPLAELLPIDQFSPFLELIADDVRVVIATEEDLDGALSDHSPSPGGDPRRRRRRALRGGLRAAARARGAHASSASTSSASTLSGPPRRSAPPAASAKPRASSRSRSAPGT